MTQKKYNSYKFFQILSTAIKFQDAWWAEISVFVQSFFKVSVVLVALRKSYCHTSLLIILIITMQFIPVKSNS